MTSRDVDVVLAILAGDVRAVRQARGMSLRDLATESGVSAMTILRIERARPGASPDGRSLIRLARWLQVQARRRTTR